MESHGFTTFNLHWDRLDQAAWLCELVLGRASARSGSALWGGLSTAVYPQRILAEATYADMTEKVNAIKKGAWLGDLGNQLGVIFGGRNKLTAEGPFLDLLMRFKDALMDANRLIVIGYSFRDDHINHLVLSWLRGQSERSDRQMVIIDTQSKEEMFQIPFLQGLRYELQKHIEYDPCGAGQGIAKHLRAGP
jgi:SIR2-like domain